MSEGMRRLGGSDVEEMPPVWVLRLANGRRRRERRWSLRLTPEAEAGLVEGSPGEPAIVVHLMTFTAPNRPAVWYFGLFKNRYDLGIGIP